MNKQEIIIVALLFVLLLGWGFYQSTHTLPAKPATPTPLVVEETAPSPETDVPSDTELTAVRAHPDTQPVEPDTATSTATNVTATEATQPGPNEPAVKDYRELPEQQVSLSNDRISVTISSWGGAIVAATLKDYRATVDADSGPVVLDFSAIPSLALLDVPGLSTNSDYTVTTGQDGKSVELRSTVTEGPQLTRTFTIGEDYSIRVIDVFANTNNYTIDVPEHSIGIGPMQLIETSAKTRGYSYLGLDTLANEGGESVKHWAKEIPGLFGKKRSMLGCSGPSGETPLPPAIAHRLGIPVAWAAAKNKYFVQIVRPDEGCSDCELRAIRNKESGNSLVVSTVSAKLVLEQMTIPPGESHSRAMSYYVGPKKYAALRKLGSHQDDVMQFGWWEWFKGLCKALLWTLNALNAVIPNYGVAVILLTAIVRIIFWPITHKSTESMKRMQEIQPLVTELREKHKDKPQKMNQEVMALYKSHKVNPMAGCLPIVMQMPVFIALFTVLRSAVELRFAGFLWISDLSEPERLLATVLPIPLNILPIFMTVTMVWQQRLTPSGGDPQQQKMMMFMPIMMLFLFYNMASALVLYWSVSQCLSIVQLLIQRRKTANKQDGNDSQK